MLLAFGLRLYRLDYQPLRGDESFGIQLSTHVPDWMVANIANVEPHPPLYYLLLHYWMQLLGRSEFATRFLSVIFGVVSVPLIYQLGRLMRRPQVGALAALLLAINPFQIWHAQDARNYTVWPALSMAALAFLLRALQEGRAKHWAGYAGMAVLSLYAHYSDLFMLLFQNLFFLAVILCYGRKEGPTAPQLRRQVYAWLSTQAFLAAAFVPWLVYGSSRLSTITQGDSPALWAVFSRCLITFSMGETVPETWRLVSLPLLLLLVVCGLSVAFKRDRYHAVFLVLYIVVPSICIFGAAQLRPVFRERYLNVIAPAYYLSISWALMSLREFLPRYRTAPLAAGVAFLGLSAACSLDNYYHNPQYQKSPDWRALSEYLTEETGPGDIIILNYPDPTLSYYYQGRAPSLILPRGLLSEQEKVDTAGALRAIAERYDRVWFYPLRDVGWDSEGYVESWLNRHATLIDSRDVYGFRWLIYAPTMVSLEEVQYLVDAGVGDAILLRGYDCDQCGSADSGPLSVEPGITLHLTLYWEATDYIQTPYSVYIHVVDASGRVLAQRDSAPRGGDFPTQEWMPGDIIVDPYSITVPSDTQPGEYAVIAGMYEPATGERLPVTDGQGSYLGDHLTLARLTVE